MDAGERPRPLQDPFESVGADLYWRYNDAVYRLMADYQRSYNPDADEQARDLAVWDEVNYDGPYYRTAQQAQEAIAYHKPQVDAAREALPAAKAAMQAAVEHRDNLRNQLARTRPWQRRKRARLREEVEQAEEVAEDRYYDFSCYEHVETRSAERYYFAAAVIDPLRRNERAQQAAENAVARSLGWRPGQPAVTSPLPRPVPMPGRLTPRRSARRAATVTKVAPQIPAVMAPRAQRPPGRSRTPRR